MASLTGFACGDATQSSCTEGRFALADSVSTGNAWGMEAPVARAVPRAAATAPAEVEVVAAAREPEATQAAVGLPARRFYKKITSGWQCLGVVQTSEDLLPGNTTDVTLDYVLDNEINKTIEFRVVVDSDCDGAGKHNECETGGEDNNEDTASGMCTSVTPPA